MTPTELRNHPAVRELVAIQQSQNRPDGDFARSMGLSFSASTWNKIKNLTYRGNLHKSLEECVAALARHRDGTPVSAELVGKTVVLHHVQQALDAVDIARAAHDEHRLVLVVGKKGAGKTRTLEAISARHEGHFMHARPSWGRGYLQFLRSFAAGCRIPSDFTSAGAGESIIIDAANQQPGLVIEIDEFNHCNSDSLNFIKAVLNETTWTIAAGTLPRHLAWMASSAQTSEEAGQLFRRAVAIVHIPLVSTRDIELVAGTLYPQAPLNGHTSALASAANRLHLMDTVCDVLADTNPENPHDLPSAIARYESLKKSSIRPVAD